MDEKKLQHEIQKKVQDRLFPLFERYNFDLGSLEAILKWKPIVLIIGNYSSGKSTLVNELLGKKVQRTGQAPTDDSFTVITAPGSPDKPGEVPGATLVNDTRLPFIAFKDYGEQLVSHFQLKFIDLPALENLAIIDSPGMLDSVTEKGRGYDFPSVIGDLARLADLVVLMFDPHKAGTIKETYNTIRNVLPEKSGEDRIVFVMSRIDECDNLGDLVRSYGTLCWNLSQMTGRKDIPRIYLTFSPDATRDLDALDIWIDERNQLKRRILTAPALRISHILHNVDKHVNELKIAAEAMKNFSRGGRRMMRKTLRFSTAGALIAVFFVDMVSWQLINFPSQPLLMSLISGNFAPYLLIIPSLSLATLLFLTGFWFFKWKLPRYIKRCRNDVDRLVSHSTPYHEHAWARIKKNVSALLSKATFHDIGSVHQRNLDSINRFIDKDLKKYFTSQ